MARVKSDRDELPEYEPPGISEEEEYGPAPTAKKKVTPVQQAYLYYARKRRRLRGITPLP